MHTVPNCGSFAYVFCSVKQVSSSKDAEQLLGRVLRMPFAKRRVIEDLNRAYAHLASSKFSKAAQELTDSLIAMGFEEMEIAAFLREGSPSTGQNDLFDPSNPASVPQAVTKAVVFELPDIPDVSELSEDEQKQFSMTKQDGESAVVRVEGEISPTIEAFLTKQISTKKEKEKLAQDIRVHNAHLEAQKAPSELGETFGTLPLMCMNLQGELELVESEVFLHAQNWNLLDYPAELPNFSLQETTHSFSIDLDGSQLSYKVADEQEVVAFNRGFVDVTENDLVRWLDRELRQPDIVQAQMLGFIAKLVNQLLQKPELNLTTLVRNQFPVSRAIRDVIKRYRKQAQKKGYQQSLFGDESLACLSDQFVYEFKPTHYPSRSPFYSGIKVFNEFGNNTVSTTAHIYK